MFAGKHDQSVLMSEMIKVQNLSLSDEGIRLWNKKFLCTCHQVMRVYVLVDKKKILVEVSSGGDKV